jgi:hypothetical protein
LGSVAIAITYYIIRVVIYIFALLVSKITKKENWIQKTLEKSLFYGDIISICIDAYIELLISGILNWQNPEVIKSPLLGDQISKILLWFCLIVAIILVPLVCLYVFAHSLRTINLQHFEQKWGTLYHQVKKTSKSALMFFPIYCVRRLVFIFICIQYDGAPIQIIVTLCLNMLILMFIGYVKPIKVPILFRLETFNEFMICSITPVLIVFANESVPQETKITYGWLMVAGIFLIIGVNVFFVLKYGAKNMVLIIHRSWNRRNS